MAYPDNVIPVHLVDPPGTAFTRFAFRYDTGMILMPLDRELPPAYQVDFANDGTSGTSITQIGDENGVSVPSQFFKDGANVWAFIWLTDGNSGYTRYKVCISLIGRPERTNEQPTPEEESAIDQAIAALNEAVADAERAVTHYPKIVEGYWWVYDAEQDDWVNTNIKAEGVDGNGISSAVLNDDYTLTLNFTDGSHYTTPSIRGAQGQQGQTGPTGATPDISIGTVSTLPAGSSATASITGTTEAPVLNLGIPQGQRGENGAPGQTGPTGATPDLTIGTVSTLPAGSDATATITGTAESPVLSLGIPKGDAGEVTESELTAALLNKADVITDTASGSIVSIPDGMASPVLGLSVDIEPIQDLHGHDNPWPAGGGKNKCSMPDTTFVQFEEVEIDEITAGTYIYSGIVTSNDVDSNNCLIIFLDAEKNTLASKALNRSTGTTRVATSSFTTSVPIKYLRLYASSGYPSGAGDTASFKDNMIESGSTATSYAPYSNLCPISGRSEVSVTRTGINVWDEEWELGNISTTDGSNVSATNRIRSKGYIRVEQGNTYYFVHSSTMYIYVYDSNKQFISYTSISASTTRTISSNVCYVRFAMAIGYGNTYKNDISINYPSTDHDYHAYTGQTVTIQLGQTVYGGTVDVTEGKLRVTHGIKTFDGSILDSEFSVTALTGYTQIAWADYATIGTPNPSFICDTLKYVTPAQAGAYTIYSSATAARMFLGLPSTVTTKAEARAWFASNPTSVIYPLAIPVEVTLTAEELDILYGDNVVFADSGNVSVNYRCDTKKYILKKIAEALNA